MKEYNNFLNSPYNDYQEIDIIVSRDCTLRCTYCYLKKSKDEIYDMDAIIESLDKILEQTENNPAKPGVVLSFYPEPWVDRNRSNLLITRSLEKLLKYPKCLSHFMIMVGTNGVNLHKPIPILDQYFDHLSLAVSLDGVKEQHDMYRVFPDGSPSWEIVKKNILNNQKKYNIYSTKVTLGPDTLKYIYESSLFLWDEMGFQDINMNVVFEDMWGDDFSLFKSIDVFEQQLDLLTSDIIKNKRWENFQYQGLVGTRNLSEFYVKKYSNKMDTDVVRPYCGSTQMRSIDSDGRIYPCFRLSPYSMSGDDVFNVDPKSEKFRALNLLNGFDSTPEKCRDCELLTSCSMCIGGAYEEGGSIFYRTTHHCEFQKMQNKYARKVFNAINGIKDV